MKNYNKTSLAVLLALGVIVSTQEATANSIQFSSQTLLDLQTEALVFEEDLKDEKKLVQLSKDQKQLSHSNSSNIAKVNEKQVQQANIKNQQGINFTLGLTPIFMHAQQKTKSDYDSLFDGQDAGGEEAMIIDGQKIKSEGSTKPGSDVTFEEKPKEQAVVANVYPEASHEAEKAEYKLKQNEKNENKNTAKKVEAPKEKAVANSTVVAQVAQKKEEKSEITKKTFDTSAKLTDESLTKSAVIENKKLADKIVQENKTYQQKQGLTKDESNDSDKEPAIPKEVIKRQQEVAEHDSKPNPKDIMTPAASALKEKIIQQSAIGESNHIFGALKREIETPKDPHTLSSLISSISTPDTPSVSSQLEQAIPSKGLTENLIKSSSDMVSEYQTSLLSKPIADPVNKFTFHLTTPADKKEEQAHQTAVQKTIEAGIKRREEDAQFLRNQQEREIKEAADKLKKLQDEKQKREQQEEANKQLIQKQIKEAKEKEEKEKKEREEAAKKEAEQREKEIKETQEKLKKKQEADAIAHDIAVEQTLKAAMQKQLEDKRELIAIKAKAAADRVTKLEEEKRQQELKKKQQEDAIANLMAVTAFERKRQEQEEALAKKKAEIDAETQRVELELEAEKEKKKHEDMINKSIALAKKIKDDKLAATVALAKEVTQQEKEQQELANQQEANDMAAKLMEKDPAAAFGAVAHQEAEDKKKLDQLANVNSQMISAQSTFMAPTASEVVQKTLDQVKFAKQAKEHPLSAGIFGVNGMNIFTQQSGVKQSLVQSQSTLAMALNNGENVIEESENWMNNFAQMKSKSSVEILGEKVINDSETWINDMNSKAFSGLM